MRRNGEEEREVREEERGEELQEWLIGLERVREKRWWHAYERALEWLTRIERVPEWFTRLERQCQSGRPSWREITKEG